MSFPPRLALATRNPGKVREILDLCADWPVEWMTHRDASWPDVEETGTTYVANALLKARTVAGATSVPAIADDSGIEVDALGGGPGPRSARFAGEDATDQENLRLLIDQLSGVPTSRRMARYRCVAAFVSPKGQSVWAEATCQGRLIDAPRGTGGFGYDPIFVPEGLDRTMAELSPDQKNQISHRGKAFRRLRALIEAGGLSDDEVARGRGDAEGADSRGTADR